MPLWLAAGAAAALEATASPRAAAAQTMGAAIVDAAVEAGAAPVPGAEDRAGPVCLEAVSMTTSLQTAARFNRLLPAEAAAAPEEVHRRVRVRAQAPQVERLATQAPQQQTQAPAPAAQALPLPRRQA